MTQEERQLLLKDLCARLPYSVRGKVKADTIVPNKYDIDGFPVETTFGVDVELQRVDVSTDEIFVSTFDNNEGLGNYIEEIQIEGSPWTVEEFKPYLRPMLSITDITDEEFRELHSICPHATFNKTNVPGWIIGINGSDYGRTSRIDEISKLIDWLNAHHFDYRGLIEKGLALEASKDMYNN